MQKEEFARLSLLDRGWIVFKQGKYIIGLTIDSKAFILYSLTVIFVEVIIDLNKIEHVDIVSFDGDDSRLDKFLDKINSELLP